MGFEGKKAVSVWGFQSSKQIWWACHHREMAARRGDLNESFAGVQLASAKSSEFMKDLVCIPGEDSRASDPDLRPALWERAPGVQKKRAVVFMLTSIRVQSGDHSPSETLNLCLKCPNAELGSPAVISPGSGRDWEIEYFQLISGIPLLEGRLLMTLFSDLFQTSNTWFSELSVLIKLTYSICLNRQNYKLIFLNTWFVCLIFLILAG